MELIERVVTHLDIPQVGAFRSTCRELCGKASQGIFLARFTHRSVDFTEAGLVALTKTLQSDCPLAQRLRNLTLVSICYDPTPTDGKSPAYYDDAWRPPFQAMLHRKKCRSKTKVTKSDKRFTSRQELAALRLQQAQHHWHVEKGLYPELLVAALDAIKSKCNGEGLASLRLTAMVQTSTTTRFTPDALNRRQMYSEESFLLATVMDALASTNLRVASLDIFWADRLCGVPCTELAAYITHKGIVNLRTVGAQIQSLSMRYSRVANRAGRGPSVSNAECCNCNTRQYRQLDGPTRCHVHRCNFGDEDETQCAFESSLASSLALVPNLTCLRLHECETQWMDGDAEYSSAVFDKLASRIHMPQLRELALQGTNLTENSLLALLKRVPNLRHLELLHVNLTEGVFSHVLDFLRKEMPQLNHLSLTDIFEHKRADQLNQNASAIPPPPIPPGPIFPPIPPPPFASHTPTETYLNTLLSFRLPKDAAAECELGGCFGSNGVVLKGLWVTKADLAYSFVRHLNVKSKQEARWERERVREFGPPGPDPFDGF